jgi:hypothetical protein
MTEGTVFASAGIRSIAELQFTLGEGPCLEAYRSGEIVVVPDFAATTAWPAFTMAALEGGFAAGFAFPMQVGAARIGTLDLYRRHRGALSEGEFRDALMLAEIATHTVLGIQASAPGEELHELLADVAPWQWHLHQATGMVSVQLGISTREALVRLRANAYASARPIGDLAADVVSGMVRFSDEW